MNNATRNRDAERHLASLMKAAVLAYYSDAWPPACSCCGATEDLCIDHVNGDGREHIATLVNRTTETSGYNPAKLYRWIIEHGFPEGFQTLCRPCNMSKGKRERCGLYHGPPLADHQKFCTYCREVKDRASFPRRASSKDGLNAHCQDCANLHQAAWRVRHGTGRHVSTSPGTVGGRIIEYLREHGPTHVNDLTAALGVSRWSVRATTVGLAQRGHIERHTALMGQFVHPVRGVYRLPKRDETEQMTLCIHSWYIIGTSGQTRIYRGEFHERGQIDGHDQG